MGLAEELKALEDLNQKGKLNDAEFVSAKAAVIANYNKAASASAKVLDIPKRRKKPRSLQRLMRHSDIRTTLNIYGHVVMNEIREAHTKVVRMALSQAN